MKIEPLAYESGGIRGSHDIVVAPMPNRTSWPFLAAWRSKPHEVSKLAAGKSRPEGHGLQGIERDRRRDVRQAGDDGPRGKEIGTGGEQRASHCAARRKAGYK